MNKLTIYKISQYLSLFYILSNLTQLASRNEPARLATGTSPKNGLGSARSRLASRSEPSRSELETAREPRAYFLALHPTTPYELLLVFMAQGYAQCPCVPASPLSLSSHPRRIEAASP
jgi:hypothetical protein